MSNSIGWVHPVDKSDQWDGFNDSGLAHFSGDPVRHLAREVIQNAYDAKGAGIVEVRIRRQEIETSSIPNLDELIQNVESCYESSKSEVKKAEIFFENARAELKKKKISVLEISDYNTLGMKGPSTNGTPFYAFMKAKGQSRKENDSASGSYGIGKFAPYVVSNIRTIFISTVYQNEDGKHVQLTQGKSILMSHDLDRQRRQGVGFWGVKEKCQPLSGIADLPDWLLRAKKDEDLASAKGSKLSVLCFDAAKNWQEHLAVSVAENFFAAISDGKLRVEIDDKYTLDQTTISEFFASEDIRKIIAKLPGEPEQFDNCRDYLTAFQGGTEVITEETESLHLGFCQVRILIGEGLPKKVLSLRNGMFITDGLTGLKSFSDFKEFVAVFHCQSQKGNELLRAMEPPRHDDFEPPLLPTKTEQTKGRAALRDLATWVRDALKRHAKDPVSEVTEIDELKDFFGDEGDSDTGKGTEEINPYGDVIIRAKPIKTQVKTVDYSSTDAESDIGDGESSGEHNGTGASGGDGMGEKGTSEGGSGGSGSQKPQVEVNNVRAILADTKSRRLLLTPVKSGKISIQLKEAGADSDYDIAIAKTNKGTLNAKGVILDVVAGGRVTLDIELNQDFSGALKVVAYEI